MASNENTQPTAGKEGLIFNIQRFSLHDGPGIRDLVFMKGCPLRCAWCCNPESQEMNPEISYSEMRCIGREVCGACVKACDQGAITGSGEKINLDRRLCIVCGRCIAACPAQALKVFGEYMSEGDVVKVVEEDIVFYARSRGGITVSGGEPSSQAEFVDRLLERCRNRGILTAIETCGHAPYERLDTACRHADLIFYDIKQIDPNKHKAFTGVDNRLILENLIKLSCAFPHIPLIVRTPIVPGFTDGVENIEGIARFAASLRNLKAYELLPYHGFGEPKYRQLGKTYALNGVKGQGAERMAHLKDIALRTVQRGETPDLLRRG